MGGAREEDAVLMDLAVGSCRYLGVEGREAEGSHLRKENRQNHLQMKIWW